VPRAFTEGDAFRRRLRKAAIPRYRQVAITEGAKGAKFLKSAEVFSFRTSGSLYFQGFQASFLLKFF
jgi:hypothetical protein